jgi:hypothetical protein
LTKLRLTGSIVVLLFTAAASLRGQDQRLTDRFPAPVAARFGALIDSAGHEGLPTDPLVLRALEGQAKGASADQIAAALTRLHIALRTSRRTLGGGATAIELTTTAAALQAGVPEARVAELHKLRGGMSITIPLSAYLDLTARGAPADRAWNRIADLARLRAADAEFTRLKPADLEHEPPPIRPPQDPAN